MVEDSGTSLLIPAVLVFYAFLDITKGKHLQCMGSGNDDFDPNGNHHPTRLFGGARRDGPPQRRPLTAAEIQGSGPVFTHPSPILRAPHISASVQWPPGSKGHLPGPLKLCRFQNRETSPHGRLAKALGRQRSHMLFWQTSGKSFLSWEMLQPLHDVL